jgi:glycosyltransferase involved in cell wall biosynthesis
MRVLYASHTSVMSGAEHTLLDLLHALPDDVEPAVISPDGDLRAAVDRLGVAWMPMTGTAGSLRLHPLQTSRAVVAAGRSVLELRAAARRLDSDLVHANSTRASLIAIAARSAGGPPVVAHLHDVLPSGRTGAWLGRGLARSAHCLLANSGYTAADFARKTGGRGRVVIVDNPVDLDRFDPARIDGDAARRALRLPATALVLGVVGQITPWKAQSDAIRALATIVRERPDAMLVVAGSAKFVDRATRYNNRAYAESLPQLAAELGVAEHVVFTGEIADVPALMAALDLLLVPSWEEPFGRVVIEALAMGTPVLATSVGGPAGIVTDGVDGALLPPREPELWGERALAMFAGGAPGAPTPVANGTRVAERYSLHAFTSAVVNSYESAIDASVT